MLGSLILFSAVWLDCVAFAGLLVLCGWFYCAAFGWFVAGFSLLVVKLICWGLICVFNSGGLRICAVLMCFAVRCCF